FPLRENATYRYSWSYEGRSGVQLVVVRRVEIPKRPVFFSEASDDGRVSSIIGANGIGLGAYELRADGVYTRDVFWRKDLEGTTAEASQLLLPLAPPPGFHVVLKGKDHDVTITARGYEDVTVGTHRYEKCLKLSVDAEGMKGIAWL